MKTSKEILIGVVAATVTTFCIAVSEMKGGDNPKDELLKVDLVPFKLTDKQGWGYEIKVDHKTFIRQESIPAISGEYPFATRGDAEKTGELVVRKLIEGKLPSVSRAEVMELGVLPK